MPMPGDVFCFSHLRWGFVYQRPNHLMSRCARDRRVFFVEEPIFDARVARLDVRHVEHGLHVVVPHLPQASSTASEVVEKVQRRLVDRLVALARVEEPMLWFYTPMALRWARHLRSRVSSVVYDCMDELSLFDGAPPTLREREHELFELADVVFTGGHSLYEAKRDRHPRVHAFPSSVDAHHFEKACTPLPDPLDQQSIPRPRLGFFGVIDERMDLGLVRALAEGRPDLQLVFIGPIVKIDPERLPRLPNVHWLGPKGYDRLPSYIAGWDVAMMPFARNAATRHISPTKTLEYLAAGKPVISTSIRDVVRPYGERGLVRIADTAEAFAAAADAAIAERGTPSERQRRSASAAALAETSWDMTWARMWALALRPAAE
jgi:UDP-galactopyranose mutase